MEALQEVVYQIIIMDKIVKAKKENVTVFIEPAESSGTASS
jgi:hypothetical protein